MDNELLLAFINRYRVSPSYYATSSGRFEIIGNHTDHNGGFCVAASCDLAINAYVSSRDDNIVHLYSEGYEDSKINLNDLRITKDELHHSSGLIKGIGYYLKKLGYKIGGFNIVSKSNIFKGAGVSSSAAFESLIAQIFNTLYNDNRISAIELAKAGQYAENTCFLKKSGLLDQCAVCFGNVSFMDFSSSDPIVKTIDFPFDDMQFVIVNTGGSHASMGDLYSSIPSDMKSAAKKVGKTSLCQTSLEEIEKNKAKLTESEYNRSKHFFEENQRVLSLVKSLQKSDKNGFLEAIRGSFISSRDLLKNMMVGSNYEGSPLEACDYANKFLGYKGACKINGGGFAGSIIVTLPKDMVNEFVTYMAAKYGRSNIATVNVNPNPPQVNKL